MSILALLEHHADRADQGVKFNAIGNCHAKNLDSIVLHDEPGNRVRMFVAKSGHTLGRNTPGDSFSIGIHPHHCDLRLVGLFGPAENHEYALTPHPTGDFMEFAYTSGVNAIAAMDATGKRAFVHPIAGQALEAAPFLPAHRLHTVFLPAHAEAAWLVIEGREDPHFKPRLWSNVHEHSFEGLYRPIEPTALANMLRWVMARVERSR